MRFSTPVLRRSLLTGVIAWSALAWSQDSRFELDHGDATLPAASATGRFTVQGTARLRAEAGSDGTARFQLKALTAPCSPANSIFEDGFE